MELTQNIKNPSLVPNWFIYSGDKVAGIHDANGNEYQFVGASEKGEDGKTPILYISADDCRWYADYRDGRGPILVSQSPAASGLVGPQGETGLSGDSVKVDSIVNENNGTTVTLAWGENFAETSSFFVPSGLSGANGKDGTDGKDGISPTVTTATIEGTPGGIKVTISGANGEHQFDIMNGRDGTGASYSFDGTTLSGDGSETNIGVNTTASMNFINSSAKSATYADQYFDIIEGKYYSISQQFNNKVDKPDITQPELNEKYLVYSTLSGDDQPKGWTDILDKVYSKSDADRTFIKNKLDNTLSGDGSSENNKLGLNTSIIDPNKQYAWTTEGWQEVAAQSNLSAGTDLKIVNSIVQVNTNGIANSAGSAFVEGINTVASGIASHAAGKNTSAYSDYSFVEGYENTDYLITGLIGANHTEGAYNQVSGVYSHIEGHANTLIGYGVHMEGGYNIFENHNLTADKSDPIGRWNIWGQSIEGMANATTAEPTSGTTGVDFGYVHGGILKVIGNGTRTKTDESDPSTEVITRSDALILYRDGSMWVQGPITANGVELGNYTPTLPLNIYGTATNIVANDSIGAIGNNCIVGSKSFAMSIKRASASGNAFAFGDDNVAYDNSFAFGWDTSATQYSFAGGQALSANNHSIALGNRNIADYRSFAFGDANTASYWSVAAGRGLAIQGNTNASTGFGGLVIGGWNKTSANALFVAGNGTNDGTSRSDAFIIRPNGNTEIYGSVSANVATGKNILAVATAASLIGASRQTSENYGVNNTAIGTTWFGVGGDGMHQGFIKYSDGGDVGALDTTSTIQLNFKPSTNNFDSVQVQINNSSVGYLIPAVTATTTAGLTNDGILHIIIESN